MTSTLSEIADQTFDYVIAGGGTAGLTVAARLIEDPSIRVAVLEAGAANIDDPRLVNPGQWHKHLGNPRYDWAFQTEPQEHANNRIHTWSRGKTLGGTSALNSYVWGRPPAEDIDAWEKLGNPGWNWKNFLEYSKKSETIHAPEHEYAAQYKQIFKSESHGHSGPIHTSFSGRVSEIEVPFQQAMMNRGIEISKDPFGGGLMGRHMALGSLDPGNLTRSYATTGYYLPHKDSPNLRVLCNALVRKVVTQTSHDLNGGLVNGTGLEFEYHGGVYVVLALKDVILSAGALKSPQILELSGIGDSRVLQPFGIGTIVDLPGVGANLQEHIRTAIVFEFGPKFSTKTLELMSDPESAATQMALNAEEKDMHGVVLPGFAWVPLTSVTETPEKARQIISGLRKRIEEKAGKGLLLPGLKEQYDLQLEELEMRGYGDCEIVFIPKYFCIGEPEAGKLYMTATALLNHPISRGSIHIRSKDPHDQPIIDPHYFEEEFDLELLVEILKFDRRVVASDPFKDLILKEVVPGPECQTDEDLKNHVKNSLNTTFHTTSTLSMLPRELNGVVDPNLRVYGTKNIRIIDLSIVPLHVAAHTQSIAYAIGEQAADIIKSEIASS